MDVEGEPPVNIIVKCEQPLSIQIPLEEVEEVWDDENVDIDDLEEAMEYVLQIRWKTHILTKRITISKIMQLSKTERIILMEDGYQYALGGKFDVPGEPEYQFYYAD
jgi:hypothetical protein